MSVSLLISSNNIPEEEWINIPLASEASFKTQWMPICRELNLEFIPLFEVGFDIDLQTSDYVMQELKLVKQARKKNRRLTLSMKVHWKK